MAIANSRFGRCSNFGNCSIADARRTVEVGPGADFVCTECAKPLLPIDSGEAPGGRKALGLVALMAALVVAAAAAWFLLRGRAAPAPAPAPAPAVTAPAAPAVVAPPPPPAAPAVEPPRPAAAPQTGDCSPADQQAGLCTRRAP